MIFCKTDEEFENYLSDSDFILCWSFPEKYYSRTPNLRAIFTPSAGKDWIDSDREGKVAIHFSHFHGELMAESLLGSITYFNNQFHKATAEQQNKNWSRHSLPNRARLKGQHIAIIGFGSIGKYCGKLLRELGCTITGIKRTPSLQDLNFADHIVDFEMCADILPEADHVVLILPGDKTTDGIITRSHLSAIKSSAVLHNIGRGNCISENDLIWALENNCLKGAALDVFENEPLQPESLLWEMGNVLITPHSTCFYDEYGYLFAEEISTKINRFLD